MILGIDPGSNFTGYAVIDRKCNYICSGTIIMSKKDPFELKLNYLSQQLDLIYDKYPIKYFSLEKIFLGKNASSAFKLGHARGVCLLSAGRHRVQVFEYAAKYVKKVVTGSGASGKLIVQSFVNQIYNVSISNEDESDALAIAHCCYMQSGVKVNNLSQFRI